MQGPTGASVGDRRLADADAVDDDVVVVGEGEDVAVAGEALAEMLGDGQALLARAQQNFGRAQSTGGEDDHIGRDRLVGGGKFLALMPERIEVDAPAPALGANMRDADLGEDFGAVVVGVGDDRSLAQCSLRRRCSRRSSRRTYVQACCSTPA